MSGKKIIQGLKEAIEHAKTYNSPMQGESERDLPIWTTRALQDAITAAEARGYERCLKEIDEKCPEFAHIVRMKLQP